VDGHGGTEPNESRLIGTCRIGNKYHTTFQ
jgi:hypothetical protein